MILVGGGPGDLGLLTVSGLEAVKKAGRDRLRSAGPALRIAALQAGG